MAKNDNQQEQDLVVEGVVVEEITTAKPAKQTLLWLAILLLLGLLAGLSWFAYQEVLKQQSTLAALTAQVEDNKTASLKGTDSLEGDVLQFKETLAKESEASQQQVTALNEVDVALAEKISEVAEMQQLTNDDVKKRWILSEVEFLLQMANQRVLLAGDVENARSALGLADQRLKDLADPTFYQLRSLLSDEQLALASVVKIDIDGLAAQLQSGINSIDSLEMLMGTEYTGEQAEGNEETAQISENWQAAMDDAWTKVRSLVVIRHQEEGASAVLIPEQRYFLYQNLTLKLESARLALLSGKETLFHESLASTAQWLEQYFIGEKRDALLETVTAMQSEKITVELPDVSASLAWLQQKGEQ